MNQNRDSPTDEAANLGEGPKNGSLHAATRTEQLWSQANANARNRWQTVQLRKRLK